MRLAPAFTAAPLVLGALLTVSAQRAPENPLFRSAIELTTVTATVVDADGVLVTGLPQSEFDVYEDGVSQPISHFTNERVPVSLALLLDSSDSMSLQRVRKTPIRKLLRPTRCSKVYSMPRTYSERIDVLGIWSG